MPIKMSELYKFARFFPKEQAASDQPTADLEAKLGKHLAQIGCAP